MQSDDEEPSTTPTGHNTGMQPEETSLKVVVYPVLRLFSIRQNFSISSAWELTNKQKLRCTWKIPPSGKQPLHQFKVWLQTPDGRKRDSKTSKQHSSQMVGLLNAINKTCDIYARLDLNLVSSSVFLESYVNKEELRGWHDKIIPDESSTFLHLSAVR